MDWLPERVLILNDLKRPKPSWNKCLLKHAKFGAASSKVVIEEFWTGSN